MRSKSPCYVFAVVILAGGCAPNEGKPITRHGSQPEVEPTEAGAPPPSMQAASDAGPTPGLGSDGGPPDAQASADGQTSDGEAPVPSEPTAAQTLVGHYAMRQRSATTASAVGTTYKSLTTSYMLVDILEREGEVRWSQRGCRSEVVSEPDTTEVTISDVVPRSTGTIEARLTARWQGSTVEWQRAAAITALGFHDVDPTLALPEDDKDPRVYDQDGDGKPGVTVHIRTQFAAQNIEGDTYNAQRLQNSMVGSFDGTRLTGQAFQTTETQVLGATNRILTLAPTPMRDETGDNGVLLVKVKQGMSCDAVLEQADRMF